MPKSLAYRLMLAFLLVALTTAALVVASNRLMSIERFYGFLVDQQRSSLETALVEYYTSNGSWDNISTHMQELTTNPNPQPPPPPDLSTSTDRRRIFALADSRGIIVSPIEPDYPLGMQVTDEVLLKGIAIKVNNQIVGTILIAQRQPRFRTEEDQYLERTNQALLYAALAAMVVALGMGYFLARRLIQPLQALTEASVKIAQGQLEQEVKIKSKDEIGQLTSAFNMMSREVARVNQMRRQITADIAHDLRTPLTVISGYIESMQDGVLQPTPQRLALIYQEIARMTDMVDDLRTLSQVDSGELPLNRIPVNPAALLNRTADLFHLAAEQQGVVLVVNAPESLPQIQIDEDRMVRVFSNLVSNALRYTPDGGQIDLAASTSDEAMIFTIHDNGTGISNDDLPYIFDRFYRAEKSRSSEESGLGLAIVKALVTAHHGQVWAESVLGQGTTVYIRLPL